MKKFAGILTAAVLCVSMLTACGDSSSKADSSSGTDSKKDSNYLYITDQKVVDSPEWLTKLDAVKDAEQIIVVAGVGDTTAYVSMHEKNKDGKWQMLLQTPGYIGLEGMGNADCDHARTPTGTFTIDKAFGIADDPGCSIPYVKVTKDLYWSSDMRDGMRYNEMVSIDDYPDLDKKNSEHLIDYSKAYQYCLNISFNEECTPGRGSAIFLHCTGNNKYTAGCVAVPKDTMVQIMKCVDPYCVVVIDTKSALGA